MIRVLLVDDHEVVRAGLRALIEGQPDMTIAGEASDGLTALDSIRRIGPDVAVLDLTMPRRSGIDVARELTNDGRSTALVVLTRHDDRAFVDELFAAGVLGYVLKQSPSSELLEAIRKAAEGQRHADRSIAIDMVTGTSASGGPAATPREREVLRLTAQGQSNKEIAATLGISVKTVEVHKSNAMRKLQLSGRADVVRYARQNGWLIEL